MKRILLYLFIFTSALTTNAQEDLSKPEINKRLDSFWAQHPFSLYENMTPDEAKKIPKYDRPDLAFIHDYQMTLNPYTLEIPHQQKYKIIEQVNKMKTRLNKNAIPNLKWQERGPNNFGGRSRAIMFDPNDAANGYKKLWAGSVSGGLWYTTDFTQPDWKAVDNFWANLAITCIEYDPTNTDIFYAGTGEGWNNIDAVRGMGIWKSTDGGKNWAQLNSTNNSNFRYVQKMKVLSNGRVLAATNNGLFKSDNGGDSWTKQQSGFFADIEIAANGDIYASTGKNGIAGTIVKSTDNGNNWLKITPSDPNQGYRIELACAPSNKDAVFAIASNKDRDIAWFKKSTDAGDNWTDLSIPKYLNDTSEDFSRGQAWYDLILCVHQSNDDIIFAGAIDLYKSTDQGNSFTPISHWYGGFNQPYVHADQHNVINRPNKPNEYIFSNDGGVFYSSDAGSSSSPSFTAINNNFNVTQFYSVALENDASSPNLIGGTQDNGTHIFTDTGINSTSEITGGDGGFCFIDSVNGSTYITSYVYNSWFYYNDFTAGFDRLDGGQTGRFINPADYNHNTYSLYAAGNKDKLFVIVDLDFEAIFNEYAVGGDGLNGRELTALEVNRFDSSQLFSADDRGNVYRISGLPTSPISTQLDPNNTLPSGYISCIEMGKDEDHLLITYSSYGVVSVWETKDGGSSWQSKEGNLPDMPIRWAIFNPKDRLQVMLATEVGVWSTTNINASPVVWEPSNSNLANVRCDMLKYRNADGLVAVATHGRGIFTTDVFKKDCNINLSIGNDTAICEGSSLTLNPNKSFESYQWNNNSTNTTINANLPGLYWLEVRDARGCIARDSIRIDIDSLPTALFSVERTDIGNNQFKAQFNNLSRNANSFEWNFGNGQNSAEINPKTTFDYGSYSVSLKAINTCGNNSLNQTVVKTASIYETSLGLLSVYPNPASDFININFPHQIPSQIEVVIANMQGKLISKDLIFPKENTLLIPLDKIELPKGMFILHLSDGKDFELSHTFVKQ